MGDIDFNSLIWALRSSLIWFRLVVSWVWIVGSISLMSLYWPMLSLKKLQTIFRALALVLIHVTFKHRANEYLASVPLQCRDAKSILKRNQSSRPTSTEIFRRVKDLPALERTQSCRIERVAWYYLWEAYLGPLHSRLIQIWNIKKYSNRCICLGTAEPQTDTQRDKGVKVITPIFLCRDLIEVNCATYFSLSLFSLS